MGEIWIVIPPWIYAVLVTWAGRWGEWRWIGRNGSETESHRPSFGDVGVTLMTNLIFLSLLPTSVLMLTYTMLPFEGARAGLALGLAAYLFGCVPARLLDVTRRGWDHTFWELLIDLLRVGGALYLVGWLVVP